jgi:hypothetical protein
LLYRFVSNAAGKWDANGRPTPPAFDPQAKDGDKGISFFRSDLLHHDPEIAASMVLEGMPDYGLIQVDVEEFFAKCAEVRTADVAEQRVEELQIVVIKYDPTGPRYAHAHYYMAEKTDTVELDPHIKDVLCEVAVVKKSAKGRKGGKPSP